VQLLAEVVMSLQVFDKQQCQDHERKHQDYIKKGFTHRNLSERNPSRAPFAASYLASASHATLLL
jgi:hypothetical protein